MAKTAKKVVAKKAAPAKKSASVKAPTTKSQIMSAIAGTAEISKKQAIIAVDTLLKIAYNGAKGKNGFVIPGLGKLIKVKRSARKGRNPSTGEVIKIPAKTVVKFRLAKAAKEAVLS